MKICETFSGNSLKEDLSIDTTFDPCYFSWDSPFKEKTTFETGWQIHFCIRFIGKQADWPRETVSSWAPKTGPKFLACRAGNYVHVCHWRENSYLKETVSRESVMSCFFPISIHSLSRKIWRLWIGFTVHLEKKSFLMNATFQDWSNIR